MVRRKPIEQESPPRDQAPGQDRSKERRAPSFDRYELPMPVDILAVPLTPMAKLTYLSLLSRCHSPQTREIVARQGELARELGVDRHTFSRHIAELVKRGWLRTEPAGCYSLRYTLCNPVLAERMGELEQVKKRLGRALYAGEALMKEWLNLLVDSAEYDDNARPGFLRNPVTGENLEYDRWYTVGVAFEFNGPQHYRATAAFPDPRQIDETRARDYMKIGMSHEHGVILVTVEPEDLTLERMKAKVTEAKLLPLRQVRYDDPVLQYLTEASDRYIYRATGRWPKKQSPPGGQD